MAENESRRGGQLVGMKAVAEEAGVAISSVSRVLSGHADVSEAMRRRVLDVVAALGYEPDLLAQGLRTGETRTMGFVMADLSNPLFALMAHSAGMTLQEHGYSLLLANSLNQEELTLAQVRQMLQRRVDGLCVSAGDSADGPVGELLAKVGIPVVLIDRQLDLPGASVVLSDHAAGLTQAVEDLLEHGHRRIALIGGLPHVLPARARREAAERAVAAHPEATLRVLSGAFSAEHGLDSVRALWREDPPTAVIAGSNQILPGVLRGLAEVGAVVPDDVSLVTCDGLPLAEFLAPPLATVWRDSGQLGRRAAQLLLELRDGGEPRSELLPTEYRATASVGPAP